MDKKFDLREDGTRYFLNRIWIPKFGEVRSLVLNEAQNSRYSIRPKPDKMYLDHKKLYWWPNMKSMISTYVGKCLTCFKARAVY